ncbi:MAG: hypothetical protein Q9215_004017 [Flavoplaca cf. flavocitrina]
MSGKENVQDARTKSISRSPQDFLGCLAKWEDFEKDVCGHFDNQKWKVQPQDAIMWKANNFTDSRFSSEQIRCCNEIEVVGRFQNNVGHVMTCVGRDLGMYLSFGDWYGGGTREVNPDLALWDYADEPLLVGEVKTPWTLDLVRLMARQNTDELRFRANFGASAGQIANYMKKFGLKYGFTGETASVNGLLIYTGAGTEKTILWYSNPIHHVTTSLPCGGSTQHDPSAFVDRVSLRECMLYMMGLAKESGSQGFLNSELVWTESSPEKGSKPTLLKLPSNQSKGKYAANPSASQSSSSKGKGREQQAHPGTTDVLAHKMNGLSMKDVRDPRQQMMTWPERDVRWDQKRETFVHRVDTKAYPVDKHEQRNGILMIKIQNKNYRGRIV